MVIHNENVHKKFIHLTIQKKKKKKKKVFPQKKRL